MPDRRKAILGYVTWFIASRVARRAASKKVDAMTPDVLQDGGKDSILMKTKSAPQAAVNRATTLVEAVRPVVQRAMNDPELHDAIRQAFTTGMDVRDELSGKPPKKAAQKIARDKKLQRKVETSAQDLQKAVTNLVEKPKKGRLRRAIGRLAVVGAVAGGVVVVLRKVKGGGGEDNTPY